MPKANVTLPGGATVTVEGTTEEVAALVKQLSGPPIASSTRRGLPRRSPNRGQNMPKRGAKGPTDYVRELIAEGFFQTKQGISAVQDKLEEAAHIYPVDSLSPTLFRLVKKKELRRIREDGSWKYVNL
jgi:hypothetical protein